MEYSRKQAKAIAQQIFDRFGASINEATRLSKVPASFLAGFVGVECGKNKKGYLVPEATRFEEHVFNKLRALRDGSLSRYQGIRRHELGDLPDEILRRLAHSYGPTQIMGWHTVKNLPARSIMDLDDPETMFFCTVELLDVVARPSINRRAWDDVLRTWNTGSPNGKTYHASYVANALKVKECYEEIAAGSAESRTNLTPPSTSVTPQNETPDVSPVDQAPEPLTVPQTDEPAIDKSDIFYQGAGAIETVERIAGRSTLSRFFKGFLDVFRRAWIQIAGACFSIFTFLSGLPFYVWIIVSILVVAGAIAWVYRRELRALFSGRKNK